MREGDQVYDRRDHLRAMQFQRDLALAVNAANRGHGWDEELKAGATLGEVVSIMSTYIINPDPNMQRVGDETI